MSVPTAIAASATAGRKGEDAYDLAHDPTAQRIVRQTQQAYERQRAFRASPEGKRARELSRHGFASASKHDAVALARNEFGPAIEAPPIHGLDLPKGQHLVKYLGSKNALVARDGTDQRAIVRSTFPLRTETDNGTLAPTDLRLTQTAAGFETANAPVTVKVGKELRDGLELPGGVALRPVQTGSGGSGELVEGKAFFADAAPATDLWVTPKPAGAEIFTQIRGVDAPEVQAYDVDMPAGGQLRMADPATGGAEIVQGGKVIAAIAPPAAFDADGVRVPMSYRVDGNRLLVTVSHRGGDFRYPILADPVIDRLWGYGYPDTGGWTPAVQGTGPWGFALASGDVYSRPYWGRGLWVYDQPNTFYQMYWSGEWRYDYPTDGRTSYITQVDATGADFDPRITWGVIFDCQTFGIWNESSNVWTGNPVYNCDQHNGWNTSVPAGSDFNAGHPGDHATMLIWTTQNGTGLTQTFAQVDRLMLWLSDRDTPSQPTLSHSVPPSNWGDTGTRTVTPSSNDPGLGVQGFDVEVPLGSAVPDPDPNYNQNKCQGGPDSQCPTTRSDKTFTYNLGNLPNGDGVATGKVTAVDPINHRSSAATWPLRIDHTNPTVATPTGTLYAPNKWVREGTYNLHLAEHDDYSGVSRSQIFKTPALRARDSFTRSTTNGWGTADTGHGWTVLAGPAANYSTDGSQAKLVAAQNVDSAAGIQTVASVDQDVSVDVALPPTQASGEVSVGVGMRLNSARTNLYRVILARGPGGRLWLKSDTANSLISDYTDTGLMYAPGDVVRLRGRVTGTNPTVISGKVWRVGRDEPAGWMINANDSTAGLQQAGTMLLRALHTAPGNTTVGFDNFAYNQPGNILVTEKSGSAPCGPDGCPKDMPHDWTWTTAGELEGTHHISTSITDVLGHPAPDVGFDVKLDRTQPTTSNKTGSISQPNAIVAPGAQTLSVDASDPLSGVQKIELLIDGSPTGQEVSGTCTPTQCDATKHADFNWDSGSASGATTVTVRVTDLAQNTYDDSWQVIVDDMAPDVGIEGSLWSANGETISAPTYDLSVDASDGDSSDPGVGVKSIVISVDGQVVASPPPQGCATDVCPMSTTWQLQTSSFDDGPHSIDIDVTDQLGNVSHDEEDVTVQKIVSSPPQTLSLESSTGQSIHGAGAQDEAGRSVADVGDLNGDGRDDYAVGAPGALVSPSLGVPRVNAGKVYVVYGTADGAPPTELSSFGSGSGFTISGAAGLDRCGSAVAAAGDVNQDGYDDMLVGCPATDGTVSAPLGTGHVYVVFGTSGPADVDLATLGSAGFSISGPQLPAGVVTPGARPFGSYLSGPRSGTFGLAADVNDDGYDDISIGSSSDGANARAASGSTYVVFGKADTSSVDVANLGSGGFRIDGATPGEHSGYAAAIVGDVSGDDYADILVTSPGANQLARANAGVAYLVYGKASDVNNVDLASLGSQGFAVYGDDGDKLGSSVASIGDADSDGLADFAIGGHGGFVVYGHDTTDGVDFRSPDLGYELQVPADASYDNSVVSGGGDLNDDGLPDVIIGFPGANSGAGSVFAVVSQAGLDPPAAPIALGNLPGQQGTRLDTSANSGAAGSALDGVEQGPDGQPAVLVGAPGASTTTTSQSGAAYVVPASRFTANGGGGTATAARKKELKCWKHRYVYPFADARTDFPAKCRWTKKANLDETFRGQARGYKRGSPKDEPRPSGGNTNLPLWAGHPLNDYAKTQLIDSNGTPLGYLQQDAQHHHKFTFYDTSQDSKTAAVNIRIRLEGTPCMTPAPGPAYDPDHDPGANALISLQSAGDRHGDSRPLVGMRVIVRRSAFKQYSFSKSYKNNQVIDSGWLSCHKLPHYRKLGHGTDHDYFGPNFEVGQRYIGRNAARSCNERLQPDGQFDPLCGTNYIHYQFPRETPLPGFPRIAIFNTSTTGVGGGGQARGVIKVGSAAPLKTNEFDKIDYLDPNVPCQQDHVAEWFYLGFKGVRGWYVATRDDGKPRMDGCPHG